MVVRKGRTGVGFASIDEAVVGLDLDDS
jgi:hypothetical protein